MWNILLCKQQRTLQDYKDHIKKMQKPTLNEFPWIKDGTIIVRITMHLFIYINVGAKNIAQLVGKVFA